MMKITVLLCALALAGCASARGTRMSEGAVIGGVGGALIGGPVGLVAGSAAGAAAADVTKPQGGRKSCAYNSVLDKTVCAYE